MVDDTLKFLVRVGLRTGVIGKRAKNEEYVNLSRTAKITLARINILQKMIPNLLTFRQIKRDLTVDI